MTRNKRPMLLKKKGKYDWQTWYLDHTDDVVRALTFELEEMHESMIDKIKEQLQPKMIQAAAQEIAECAQNDHREYEDCQLYPGDGTIRLTVPLSGEGINFHYSLRDMVKACCEGGDAEYRRLTAKLLRELADLAEVSK